MRIGLVKEDMFFSSSRACLAGDDGEKVEHFRDTCTDPSYQDSSMVSGMARCRVTEGVREVRVKSWSDTSKEVFSATRTCN